MVTGWLTGRLATRVLKIGRRFSIPMRVLLTAVPPLAASVRSGATELNVLASLAVHRLRAAGIEPDERRVQRIVVNAYCRPELRAGLARERAVSLAQIGGIWAARAAGSSHDGSAARAAATIEAATAAELGALAS
jgi:non-ribosomal peptide synthetase component F